MPVYFLRAGTDGPVKIGHAKNLRLRQIDLQAGCPEPLRLIRQIGGARRTEYWMHRELKEFHLRGEWFIFNPIMLSIEPPQIDETIEKNKREGGQELAALRMAIKIAGSENALARAIGGKVSQAHVNYWLNKSKNERVPAEAALAIEMALEGKITAVQLRPDLFGEQAGK